MNEFINDALEAGFTQKQAEFLQEYLGEMPVNDLFEDEDEEED